MFSVKEVLLLVAVQHNNSHVKNLAQLLTDEECATRMLSKENQKALGLKSPKLSKALMKLGLSKKVVSQALASANNAEIPRVSADVADLLEMGDSVHYKSCQRTGGQLRTVEELLPFLGTSLWLYVVGERQSLNGSGFKARRLLRMMYHDAGCTKPAGVYLETVYGDPSLLPNEEVKRFFELPLFEEGYEKQQIPLFCPSAEYGYNDTLRRGIEQFFYSPVECKTSKSIVVQAYQTRPKSDFAYICSLAENRYNPQNGKFSTPPLERGWRGFITPKQRTLIQAWIEVFGYPQQRFERGEVAVSSVIGDLKLTVAQKGKDYGFCYRKLLNDFPVKFLSASPEKMEVIQDLPELRFWKPLSVFERWIKKEGEVTTEELSLVEFWVGSFGYPAEGEYFTSHYQKLNITHQGYTFCIRLYNGEKSIILESSNGVRKEEYLFTHSLYYGKHEVWYTEPKLGFWQAISLDLGKATIDCCNLLGFCPVEVGERFSYGESTLYIVLNSSMEYSLVVIIPNERFPHKTLLEVKEDSLKVKYNLPELGFLKAVTLEEEFYGESYYTEARIVQRDCPELGFLKAVPIINYQVNDSLWVTGPLPTK